MVTLPVVKFFVEKLNIDLIIKNSEGKMPIHYACKRGEIDIVRYLYEECKVSINTGDNNGSTPLLMATIGGKLAVIEYLIKQGCDPLQKNNYGNTIAHLAALNGHVSVLERFKEQLNITNNGLLLPIHYAKNCEVVRFLVRNCEVDMNSKDKCGNTPLLVAAVYGHLSVIEYWIEHGCDPLHRNNNGDTAVHLAALNGHLSVVKFFVEKLNIDLTIKNSKGKMPIHFACDTGGINVVQYLYEECKVSINVRDNNGTTPLHWAAVGGELAVIEYLIKQGCDPLQKNNDGDTIAHIAAFSGHVSVLERFKEQLNITNNELGLPIHYAKNCEVVRFLVRNCEVDMNSKDKDGNTPLLIAARNGHLSVIEYWIEHGSDPLQRNNNGEHSSASCCFE